MGGGGKYAGTKWIQILNLSILYAEYKQIICLSGYENVIETVLSYLYFLSGL